MAIDEATNVVIEREELFIDGQFRRGGGASTDVVSPATGATIATIQLPSESDLNGAVAAARAAQPAWSRRGAFARADVCHRIAERLSARRDVLARLQTLEQGKPLAESYADVDEAATLFHLHAEDAVRLNGETYPSTDPHKRMWTTYRAVGVWGIITPWNFPLLMFAEFAAPGLATGNALVVKPPTHTSLTVLAAMDAMNEAELPAGLVNIVPGAGDVGELLVGHEGVDAIGFIGSSATGARIQSLAGLKRSLMECSGNGPLVVLDDADVGAAAAAATRGAYFCAGQVCCATERVLVHAAIHEPFVAELMRCAESVRLGDPFDERTNLGPLNNEGVAAKMDRHLADARRRGARILTGGARRAGFATDLYYDYTVVDDVPEDSLLSREESFGPVVPVIVGHDDDDLLRIANADPLGLQGAVFTSNIARAFRFAEELEVGQVVVNDSNGYWDVNMPFGGAGGKHTGWGRIGGKHTLYAMTDLRTTVVDLSIG